MDSNSMTYLSKYKLLINNRNQKDVEENEYEYWKDMNKRCNGVADDISGLINDYVGIQSKNYNLILNNINLVKNIYYRVSKLYPKWVLEFYTNQSNYLIKPWDYSIFDISILNDIPCNKGYWGIEGIYKLNEDYKFIESLIKSYRLNLIDLDVHNKKSLDSFSYYLQDKDLTFISIFPQKNIHDNIYFYHEIGHAYFNYLNHIPNSQMAFIKLFDSEKMAYHFEMKYAKYFLKDNYEYYRYNFYSLLCMFAVKSAFEIFCYLHARSNVQEKTEIYQTLTKTFTPWVYSLESTKKWCMQQRNFFENPFYNLAYFLSQSESICEL